MSAFLWRVLVAVLCVILALAVIPPLFRVVGFPVNQDVLLIVRVVVAGLAVLYVLRERPW